MLRTLQVAPSMKPKLPFLVVVSNCHLPLFQLGLHGIVMNGIDLIVAFGKAIGIKYENHGFQSSAILQTKRFKEKNFAMGLQVTRVEISPFGCRPTII